MDDRGKFPIEAGPGILMLLSTLLDSPDVVLEVNAWSDSSTFEGFKGFLKTPSCSEAEEAISRENFCYLMIYRCLSCLASAQIEAVLHMHMTHFVSMSPGIK